jgi:(4-(4-[2-(gamma-L-glutamylamino)ethyl]phenoxymethyl)furan-2-yl)methanamine synthase
MTDISLGLDIGGANIKVADSQGNASSWPFALWKEPSRLAFELEKVAQNYPQVGRIGISMTGELCDCFDTKRDGVHQILNAIETTLGEDRARIWSVDVHFVSISQARKDYLQVAAANWHSLATFVGRFTNIRVGLMVDTGSTTTDIIPMWEGKPCPLGKTDIDRLQSGELVYTGAKRTPLCNLMTEKACAEFFATTEDVYVRLGLGPIREDATDTADGRSMTARNAQYRLARMLGGDGELIPGEVIDELCLDIFRKQRKLIENAIREVCSQQREIPSQVVFSGSGEFLAKSAWKDFISTVEVDEANPIQVSTLVGRYSREVSESACAYALAILAQEDANAWN